MLNDLQKSLLKEVAGLEAIPNSAVNIRIDGKTTVRNESSNVSITSKKDSDGIEIRVKANTKNERVDLPVILTKSGLTEIVYNDFIIEDNCDVTIVAGCGICNTGHQNSEHDGVHSFYIGKNSKVKYIEKHYGEGDGMGLNILNPTTKIEVDENGYFEMDTAQIKGVDSTNRITTALLKDNATLIVHEKIMTHGTQTANTEFTVDLQGVNSTTHVVSRSIAKDESKQAYVSTLNGNNKCNGRTECDAIIMNNGKVIAEPKLTANHIDASLVHEAAIGKIAGEQLIKLMSLGLTEKEAEEQIVNGFLK